MTGPMAGVIKDSGRRISCMVREFTRGLTLEGTKESTWKTKSTGSACTSGRTASSTKATGSMASSTGKAASRTPKIKAESESGTMESAKSGYPAQ